MQELETTYAIMYVVKIISIVMLAIGTFIE